MLACFVPVGRIRSKAEVDDSASDGVLSLNIISAKNIKSSHNSNRWLKAPAQFPTRPYLRAAVPGTRANVGRCSCSAGSFISNALLK